MATDIIIPENIIGRLNDLPKEVRLRFWEQLERLLADPAYPSLRNEKLKGTPHWAFSITMKYRAAYLRTAQGLIITAIGTHQEVLGR